MCPRRCPGTEAAISAQAARQTSRAFALCEALLRLSDPESSEDLGELNLEGFGDPSDPEHGERLVQQLLGGREASRREEDLWIHERLR